MATIVRREVRKRGFFGWLFLLIFLGFNALMLLWVIDAASRVADLEAATSQAEEAGRAVGGVIGFGMILFVWTAGSVILGLLALLTRGRKTIVTEETA